MGLPTLMPVSIHERATNFSPSPTLTVQTHSQSFTIWFYHVRRTKKLSINYQEKMVKDVSKQYYLSLKYLWYTVKCKYLTKLTTNELENLMLISKRAKYIYHVMKYFLRPDINGRNGDCVCIYGRNNINFQHRADHGASNLECLMIKVTKPCLKPLLVSTWYRPPQSCPVWYNWCRKFGAISSGQLKL